MNYKKLCSMLTEMTNASVGVASYESPARPWKIKKTKKKKKK